MEGVQKTKAVVPQALKGYGKSFEKHQEKLKTDQVWNDFINAADKSSVPFEPAKNSPFRPLAISRKALSD